MEFWFLATVALLLICVVLLSYYQCEAALVQFVLYKFTSIIKSTELSSGEM